MTQPNFQIHGLDLLISDLGKMPAELRDNLRPAMRKAAQPIMTDAKRRASWSSRIPGAITLRTSFTARNPGVRLRVDAKKAPHARVNEYPNRGRNIRFRVFGRDVWREMPARPFFWPAVAAGRPDVIKQSNSAILETARNTGWR